MTFVGGECVFDRAAEKSADVRFRPSHQLVDAVALSAARVLLFGYLLGSIPFGLIVRAICPARATCARSAPAISARPMCCAPARNGRRPPPCCSMRGKGAAAVLMRALLYGNDMARVRRARRGPRATSFPVWLGFKGGKGVATFLGVMLALYWPVGLLAGATWLAVAGHVPHLVAVGAGRRRAGARLHDCLRPAALCRCWRWCWPLIISIMHRGEYRPAAQGRRAAHRREAKPRRRRRLVALVPEERNEA